MATRAIINIKQGDLDSDTVTTVYNHWDGYPDGLGGDLISFLSDVRVVNGLSNDGRKVANGMECLAAQVIDMLKDGPGDVYLYPPDTNGMGEEYTYTIYLSDNSVRLRCVGDGEVFNLNMTKGETYK